MEHADIELVPGLWDANPLQLKDVRIAIEGGFVHVEIPGSERAWVFSAPGIRRISYPTPAGSCAI